MRREGIHPLRGTLPGFWEPGARAPPYCGPRPRTPSESHLREVLSRRGTHRGLRGCVLAGSGASCPPIRPPLNPIAASPLRGNGWKDVNGRVKAGTWAGGICTEPETGGKCCRCSSKSRAFPHFPEEPSVGRYQSHQTDPVLRFAWLTRKGM